MIKPTSASLLLTEDCNLACTYCFEKHNKKYMTKETARKAIDYLISNATERIHILLFGGEPFLNIKTMKEVLDYGYTKCEERGLKFSVNIITNGTIITDEIKEILKDYSKKIDLSIQLSIDGIEESHDLYRKYHNGTGSFKQIEKNFDSFKEITDNIVIHGCINRSNLKYLYQNYKYFKDKGFKKIWYMPVHEEEWTAEDVNLYDTMLERIMLSGLSNLEELILTYSPFDKCLSCLSEFPDPCGAGKTFISITPDGDIYPCHRMYFYDKNTRYGSLDTGIEETELQKLLENYTTKDMSCRNCTHVNCHRCIAANYEINKDPLKQIQGNYCRMSKVEQEFQMRLLAEILNRVGEN